MLNSVLLQQMNEQLLRINRVLLEKLEATSYVIPAAERAAVASLQAFSATYKTLDDLTRIFQPRLGTMAEAKAPNGVLVRFAEVAEGKKTISKAQARELIDYADDSHTTTAFFIVNGSLYFQARDVLEAARGRLRVVVFTYDQLGFNVTKHRRVPRHILLSSAEASQWLATTQLKRSQLPRIFEDDPQARWLDAEHGQLIKVINPSPTVGYFPRHLAVVRRLVR